MNLDWELGRGLCCSCDLENASTRLHVPPVRLCRDHTLLFSVTLHIIVSSCFSLWDLTLREGMSVLLLTFFISILSLLRHPIYLNVDSWQTASSSVWQQRLTTRWLFGQVISGIRVCRHKTIIKRSNVSKDIRYSVYRIWQTSNIHNWVFVLWGRNQQPGAPLPLELIADDICNPHQKRRGVFQKVAQLFSLWQTRHLDLHGANRAGRRSDTGTT